MEHLEVKTITFDSNDYGIKTKNYSQNGLYLRKIFDITNNNEFIDLVFVNKNNEYVDLICDNETYLNLEKTYLEVKKPKKRQL